MKFIEKIKGFTLSLMVMFCSSITGEVLNEKDYFNRLAKGKESIWIATNKGVVRYDKTDNKAYNANNILGIDGKKAVTCIDVDKCGKLWYTIEGIGCFSYDGDKIEYHIDLYKENLLRLSFAFDNDNQTWLSAGGYYISITDNDVLRGYTTLDNQSLTQGAYIMDMEFDSKGNLWIAMNGEYNSLLCHKANDSFCETVLPKGNSIIPSLTIDKNDNIWYSVVNGIYHYNTTTNEKTRYWNDTNRDIPAAHFFASDIDKDGNVWFTSSHYLLRYDGKNFKWWNCYGYHNARGILCDDSCVWIFMSDNSLFKFEDEKFEIIDLEETTGTIESTAEESNTKAYVSDGVLYIENAEGINTVTVYDAMGRNLTPNPSPVERGATNAQIELPSALKGVIMVKVNNEIVKVSI